MIDAQASLLTILTDTTGPHEAVPENVDPKASWGRRGRVLAGNAPKKGWTHLTGWGQAFYRQGAQALGSVSIRNMQTWAVKDGVWHLLQDGNTKAMRPYGENFRVYNAPSARAVFTEKVGEHLTAKVPAGHAYHWWHVKRQAFPQGHAGVLVLFQAKAIDTDDLLVGAGADYYLDASSPGDNYKNQTDIAIGRLRALRRTWGWFGMTTATAADLMAFDGEPGAAP